MPAFVFISGYLTNLKKDKVDIIRSSAKILLTYIVMQIAMALIYGATFEEFLLVPQYAMWYLLALPIWRLLTYFVKRVGAHEKYLLGVTVILAAVSGYIPIGKEVAFQRVLSFYPMFILGLCLRGSNFFNVVREKYKWICIGILVATFILFIVGNRMILSGTCSSVYESHGQMIFRCGSLMLGWLMSIAFICCIPSTPFSITFGKNTLFIYCYHVFFVYKVIPALWEKMGITPNILVLIIYSLLVFVLLCILSKVKLLNKIISPFS